MGGEADEKLGITQVILKVGILPILLRRKKRPNGPD
jgi:hypothetical protein